MKTEYKLPSGNVLTISNDDHAASPREMGDMLGTMVCFHRRYELGDNDKHSYKSSDFEGWGELLKAIKRDHKPLAILPLYLLDHSGLSISTRDFGDTWDSGMVGFIFVQKKDKVNLWGKHRLTQKKALDILESEVKEYDAYLRGHTYGYTLEKVVKCNLDHEHREHLDSCWGFVGQDLWANGLLDSVDLSHEDTAYMETQIPRFVPAKGAA